MRSILVVALLLSTACGGSGEARTTTPSGGPGGRGGNAARVTPVEIAVAQQGRVARTITLASTIEPLRMVAVNAQIGGPLGTVNVREGTSVARGAVLASIQVPELNAQIRNAEATLEFAASTARRSEQLARERIITEVELERDRTALASAQATLDALRARVAFATIRAPMGGVIMSRFVESGDIVSPNQRLFVIGDVSTLVARVQVSELDVAALRSGNEVRLTVDAIPGERLTGRIQRIFPAADSVTRMIPVEVAITGSSAARLRPGYTMRATFDLAARDDAVLVPVRAITGTTGSQAVMLIQEGKPVRRAVRIGAEVSGRVEILEGVQVGDTVIVVGAQGLREGANIRIVEPLEDRPGRPSVQAPVGDSAQGRRGGNGGTDSAAGGRGGSGNNGARGGQPPSGGSR